MAAKEYILIEVSDDAETLTLSDGSNESKWSVEPGDNTIIATWLPTATIRVKRVNPGSAWPYELENLEDTSVRAMKLK